MLPYNLVINFTHIVFEKKNKHVICWQNLKNNVHKILILKIEIEIK